MTEPAKAWGGTVTGKVVVGREVSFGLRTPDEALIRKDAPSGFDLYFEIADPLTVVGRVAFSNEPNKWIDVPPPPLAITIKLAGSDDEKYEMLMRARLAWASEIHRLGADIPGFEIASFANTQDTNSQEGLQRLHDNRMRTFLLLSTSGHFWPRCPTNEPRSAISYGHGIYRHDQGDPVAVQKIRRLLWASIRTIHSPTRFQPSRALVRNDRCLTANSIV
jgi:hypothetical protein